MIHDLKPYPALKSSGLPWLGKVPEHWSLLPNRALMRRRKVLVGARHSEYQLLSLTKGGVIVRDIESGKGKFSADMGTSQEVRAGDLVFCLFDVPETPRTVGLSRHDGMITGAYTVFECSDPLVSAFLDLFYRAMDDRKLLSPLYSGLRNTIPPTRFLGTKTPLPPVTDQSAIVRFLDYADRRIRRYILAKQKLIKLLEAQKQAIIHRAVTRGLDLNIRLKSSGVEWLGDVPEHWEVRRNGRLFAQRNQTGFAELPILEVSLKTGVRVRNFENSIRKQVMSDRRKYKRAAKGDIAYNMMRMWQGAVGVAPVDGLVSPAYIVARPFEGVEVRYFSHLFRTSAYMSEVDNCSRGIVKDRNRLYWEDFKQMTSPYPALDEQIRIADAIDENTCTINQAIGRALDEISLLREYRMRLISDVVTGKLDVRAAAAKLPEETAESESLDSVEDTIEEETEDTDLGAVPEEAEA